MSGGVVDGENNVGGPGHGGGAGGEVLKEIGQLGLGAHQFSKSEPLEVGLSRPAWVGGFLQNREGLELAS